MKPVKTIILFIALILATCVAEAAPYYFSRYQVESGLSNNTVICSMQDRMGFLWFGTKDGLNRFDGYTFKIFREDALNPNSLKSNFIHTLAEDKKGRMWVGTDRGLFIYSPLTESFKLLKGCPTEDVREIQIDRNGNIWFIAGFTLFKFDESRKKLTEFTTSNYFEATSISILKDGQIWVSSRYGTLEQYRPSDQTFDSYDVSFNSEPEASKWIEKISDTGKGSLFIGTSSQGVKLFDISTRTYKNILTRNTDNTEIFARNFMHESGDCYWIATESGIYLYNIRTGSAANIKKQYNNPYSLSDNAVYTLCKDREGGIWAGTYFGGLNYYPRQYNSFEKFFPMVGENSLGGNVVREIVQDKYSNLWIGTEDAGLNKLEAGSMKFVHFKPSGKPHDIASTNIHGLLLEGDSLWVGTFENGLDLMDIRTGKIIKHYSAGAGNNSLKSNFIYSIHRSRSGDIFFCTSGGFFMYNRKEDNFIHITGVPERMFYSTMLEDSKGIFWLGSYREGLYYYNPRTGKKGSYTYQSDDPQSLGNNRINRIFEDRKGSIWLATEGGLCRMNPQTGKFRRFTTANGLPSNLILSMLEDDEGQLWVSTSRGLAVFNPETGKIRTYTKAHGLLSDQLNYNSAFKDNSGRMYFGSVNGLVRFRPTSFVKNAYKPPVYITGFQIFGQEINVQNANSPLKESITFTKRIRLTHEQSSFSIDFSALSYTSLNTTEYAYKMEGLDNDWTYLKTNRKAYFTSLPPGSYIFKVKAANNSGVWNNEETHLEIEIVPPLWKSKWALIFYVLLLFALVYLAIRTYHQRIKTKNKRRLEIFEHKKEKEIYQAKIEFFTNVAHEIRTPLTLIKGPMEKIIKRAEEVPQIKNNLLIMQKNTERLLNLTNQLLDFRKTETKEFSLNFVKADICELVRDNYIRFKPAAEQKSIRFMLEPPANKFFAYIDVGAFDKIMSNLINNAIKYGSQTATIQILPVFEGDLTFTILIKNDGYIIPWNMKEKIFDTFYRMKITENQPGSGLGLSISRSLTELHKGNLELRPPQANCNVFAVTLPLHQQIEFNPIMSK